jgi:hypothetical protein
MRVKKSTKRINKFKQYLSGKMENDIEGERNIDEEEPGRAKTSTEVEVGKEVGSLKKPRSVKKIMVNARLEVSLTGMMKKSMEGMGRHLLFLNNSKKREDESVRETKAVTTAVAILHPTADTKASCYPKAQSNVNPSPSSKASDSPIPRDRNQDIILTVDLSPCPLLSSIPPLVAPPINGATSQSISGTGFFVSDGLLYSEVTGRTNTIDAKKVDDNNDNIISYYNSNNKSINKSDRKRKRKCEDEIVFSEVDLDHDTNKIGKDDVDGKDGIFVVDGKDVVETNKKVI